MAATLLAHALAAYCESTEIDSRSFHMAIDAKVRSSHFQLSGVAYFRGHADTVQLGDVGQKKTPAL